MSYRVPAVGETWHSRVLPNHVAVEILALEDDGFGDPIVSFRSTTTFGTSSKVSDRRSALGVFVHHYAPQPTPEV